jgi:serine/threonine-protein kinase
MACVNELKELLGDYARGVLAEEKAALVREHLKECPDCRSDLEQIRLLRKGFARLAEEHIPIDLLLEYHHSGKTSPMLASRSEWNSERIEAHLSICGQCQGELKTLAAVREELEAGEKTYPEKPASERWSFFPSRKLWYAVPAAAALILMVLLNLPVSSKGPNLAVLPFEYSGPAERETFAEGLVDDISRNLEKISAVGVISSASSAQYKNTGKKPKQIGEELGVDYFLTGTIRWDTAGKFAKIKIVTKLIRTEDETVYWTDGLELLDVEVCSFPGAIVRQVAAALNVALLEPERRALEACPTGNIEAYEYYLRGNLWFNRRTSHKEIRMAIALYQKAVELDSSFALAYTQLSRAGIELYWHHQLDTAILIQAKKNLDEAFRLQPKLPEAQVALGSYYYHSGDYGRALGELEMAGKSLPNNSEVLEEMAYAQRLQGRWDKALENIERSLVLDPRSVAKAHEAATMCRWMRKYEKAEHYFDIAVSLDSADIGGKAWLYITWRGDTKKARAILRKAFGNKPSGLEDRLDLLDGNYQNVLDRLDQTRIASGVLDNNLFYNYFLQKAQLYGFMNRLESMRTYYDSARIILEKKVKARPEELVGSELQNFGRVRFHTTLGEAYAGLGRKEEAIREAKKGVELVPVSKNAIFGPRFIEDLARVNLMVGDYDAAIAQLEYLLSIPGELSVPLLRLDPTWAPLRSHPRFKKLINERA